MFTQRFSLACWNGYRADLVRTLEIAAAEIAEWAGYASTFDVNVEFKSGLTHQTSDLDALRAMDHGELRAIRDVAVYIRGDDDAWTKEAREREERGEELPQRLHADVRLRLWRQLARVIRMPSSAVAQAAGSATHQQPP